MLRFHIKKWANQINSTFLFSVTCESIHHLYSCVFFFIVCLISIATNILVLAFDWIHKKWDHFINNSTTKRRRFKTNFILFEFPLMDGEAVYLTISPIFSPVYIL